MTRMARKAEDELPRVKEAAEYFARRDNWPGGIDNIRYHRTRGDDGKFHWYVRTMATVETADNIDTVAFDGETLVKLMEENERRTEQAQEMRYRLRWHRRVAIILSFGVAAAPVVLALKGCG